MSLYAIGDLHLHYQAQLKNRSQLHDPEWKGHEERLKAACAGMIGPEDTLLLMGDHTWGRGMAECETDFRYIEALPGRKILLRGNHDMFWDVNKTAALNRLFEGRLFFLQNNFASYGDTALVGTKGFTFEGPFYLDRRGRVIGWDEDKARQAEKLVQREEERLRLSFDGAVKAGYRKFIMLLHYPPTNILESESMFTRLAEEYRVSQVIYAHCHGKSRFHDSILGMRRGVMYRLVSGDYLDWRPERILD